METNGDGVRQLSNDELAVIMIRPLWSGCAICSHELEDCRKCVLTWLNEDRDDSAMQAIKAESRGELPHVTYQITEED